MDGRVTHVSGLKRYFRKGKDNGGKENARCPEVFRVLVMYTADTYSHAIPNSLLSVGVQLESNGIGPRLGPLDDSMTDFIY